MWNRNIFWSTTHIFSLKKYIMHVFQIHTFLNGYMLSHCVITKMSINEDQGFCRFSVTNTNPITILEHKSLCNQAFFSVEYKHKIKSRIYSFFFTFCGWFVFLFCQILNSFKIMLRIKNYTKYPENNFFSLAWCLVLLLLLLENWFNSGIFLTMSTFWDIFSWSLKHYMSTKQYILKYFIIKICSCCFFCLTKDN